MKLSNSLLERINVVAVATQRFFIDEGLATSHSDQCIWNNASFIIAFLIEFNICSVVDMAHFVYGFQRFYKNEDERLLCGVWLREGVSFYRRQIKDMRLEVHSLPDVIIYNLLNPNIDKKSFGELSLFDIDILVSVKCWEHILDLIDEFFLSDPNLKVLERGC